MSSSPSPSAPDPAALSVTALEQLAVAGWPGVETARLGEWWLRAGHGFTGRANSALAVGDPGRPVEDALAAVVAFYAVRGLVPQLQVAEPRVDLGDPGGLTGAPGVEAAALAAVLRTVDRLGWIPLNAAWVLTAPLGVLITGGQGPDVRFDARPSPEWLAGYQYRGNPLPPEAVEVVASGAEPVFARLMDGDTLLGVARGSVSAGWLGITAVTVGAAYRRRGVARALMQALAGWAAERGADRVYLQVDVHNDGALTMYDRLGFTVHHRYHYRRPA